LFLGKRKRAAGRRIPTVGDFVPGYEASAWFGIGAPKATPAEVVDKLNKEINAALADPKMKARIADLEQSHPYDFEETFRGADLANHGALPNAGLW
jgi:tripartite-type tricarboxylate transporter receptor subunit TctC